MQRIVRIWWNELTLTCLTIQPTHPQNQCPQGWRQSTSSCSDILRCKTQGYEGFRLKQLIECPQNAGGSVPAAPQRKMNCTGTPSVRAEGKETRQFPTARRRLAHQPYRPDAVQASCGLDQPPAVSSWPRSVRQETRRVSRGRIASVIWQSQSPTA